MIQARSIGSRAESILARGATGGRVLACFASAWDLETREGQLLVLAWPGQGEGPLTIYLDDRPGAALPAGTRFVFDGSHLVAPGIDVGLSAARPWPSRPPWRRLAARRQAMAPRLATLAAAVFAAAPAGSLADLLPGRASLLPDGWRGNYLSSAAAATSRILDASGRGDVAALQQPVSALCGLGPGLTPAGDDWLAGWLLALHIGSFPSGFLARAGAAVLAASSHTTTISRAYLACAARGEADASWHALLAALAWGPDSAVDAAARAILGHGSTSGADMLAGFLAGAGLCERTALCF